MLKIKDEPTEQEMEMKYLAIVLDSQPNFKNHGKRISETFRANLNCFKMIRNCLTFDSALMFLNSVLLPRLSYGVTTWSQASQSVMRSIECL